MDASYVRPMGYLPLLASFKQSTIDVTLLTKLDVWKDPRRPQLRRLFGVTVGDIPSTWYAKGRSCWFSDSLKMSESEVHGSSRGVRFAFVSRPPSVGFKGRSRPRRRRRISVLLRLHLLCIVLVRIIVSLQCTHMKSRRSRACASGPQRTETSKLRSDSLEYACFVAARRTHPDRCDPRQNRHYPHSRPAFSRSIPPALLPFTSTIEQLEFTT